MSKGKQDDDDRTKIARKRYKTKLWDNTLVACFHEKTKKKTIRSKTHQSTSRTAKQITFKHIKTPRITSSLEPELTTHEPEFFGPALTHDQTPPKEPWFHLWTPLCIWKNGDDQEICKVIILNKEVGKWWNSW